MIEDQVQKTVEYILKNLDVFISENRKGSGDMAEAFKVVIVPSEIRPEALYSEVERN